MARRKNNKPAEPTLDELRARRAEIAEKLAEADRIEAEFDAVFGDLDEYTQAVASAGRLRETLAQIDGRIAHAEREKALGDRERADAERVERLLKARADNRAVNAKLAKAYQKHIEPILREGEASQHAIRLALGSPFAASLPLSRLIEWEKVAIKTWRKHDPELIGEKPVDERAVYRQTLVDAVERAEKHLEKMRALGGGRFQLGERPIDNQYACYMAAHAVKGARYNLWRYDHPDATDEDEKKAMREIVRDLRELHEEIAEHEWRQREKEQSEKAKERSGAYA